VPLMAFVPISKDVSTFVCNISRIGLSSIEINYEKPKYM